MSLARLEYFKIRFATISSSWRVRVAPPQSVLLLDPLPPPLVSLPQSSLSLPVHKTRRASLSLCRSQVWQLGVVPAILNRDLTAVVV